MELESEIDTLKDEMNTLKLENSDLQRAMLMLKYTRHPGNQEMDSNVKDSKTGIDTESEGVSEDLPIVTSRDEIHNIPCPKALPTLSSCLHLIFPFNLTSAQDRAHKSSDDIRSSFHEHWKMLQRVTSDLAVKDSIMHQWISVGGYKTVEQSQELYNEIGKVVLQKLHDAHGAVGSIYSLVDETKEKMMYIKSEFSRAAEKYNVTKFVNKTRSEMLSLSHKVYDTFLRVKNLTTDVLTENTMFGDQVSNHIAYKLHQGKEKIVHMKNQVQENLVQFTDKISRDWWPRKEKYKNRGTKKHSASKRQLKHSHSENNHNVNSYDNEYVISTFNHEMDKYEEKHDHTKKQSNPNHELYNDFWKKTGYYPDDYSQDGFFQGNNHKWSKHEKEFRRIQKKIEFLNSAQFYSMDDDDIDHLYEELDDVEDKLEDDTHKTEQLTWLTCQQRWWKSRRQRKHKSRYLLKGCGITQLANWQIYVLCTASPTELCTKDYDTLDCFNVENSEGHPIDNWYLRWSGQRGQYRHSSEWYVNRMNLRTEL